MTHESSIETDQATAFDSAMDRLRAELAPRLRGATVPIYGWQEKPILDRTGVLLQIQDKHFILTAAHGRLNEIAARIPLAVGWDEESGQRPRLEHFSIHKPVEEETVDVAVIDLPADVATRLRKNHTPITLRDIDERLRPATGAFVLFGYPEAWSKPESYPDPPAVLLFTEPYRGEFDAINREIKFDQRAHIAVQFSRDLVNYETGARAELPKTMAGISGCGIWHIDDDLSCFDASFDSSKCKLVAIQNVRHGGMGYAVGTRVRYALDALFYSHPELEKARTLVYPS